ncbi:MAG: hypothetical protein MJ248_07135 [Bacilli bacterium]|nr:hypothetical protein [Bacilli bacterium]
MHTKKSLLLVVATSMLLGACGGKATDSSTKGDTSNGGDDDTSSTTLTPVEKVLASIGDTWAFSSEMNIRQFYGTPGALEEDSFTQLSEVFVSNVTTVIKTTYDDDDDVYVTRYDKDEEGYLSTYMLNYTNNTVETIPYVYSGSDEPAPYSVAFGNPFKGSAADWDDDGDGTLTYKGEDATGAFNESMFVQLTSFYGTGLSDFKISYNKDTYVATGFTAHDLEDEIYEPEPEMADFMDPFESGQELTLTATFTDPEEYDLPAIPEAVSAQEGQSELENVFKELRKGNYTATYEYKQFGWAWDDELEDVVPALTDGVTNVYFTPTSYYFENCGDMLQSNANFGGFVNSDGKLQRFAVDEYTNGVSFTSKPVGGLNNPYEYFFGSLFSYCGQVFNVEEDGSYTLPNVVGLYEEDLLAGAFGPDNSAMGSATIVPGSLSLRLTTDGLVYEYETTQGPVKCTISNIGSTTFDVDVSEATPYVPETNIFNWLIKIRSYDMLTFVSQLTVGKYNEVPFVEPAGNYQINFRRRYLHDPETDTDIGYNYSFEIYCECTNMADYNDYVNEFKAIADANENLEYDEETDGYVYKNEEGIPMWEVYGQNFEEQTGSKFVDLWGREYNQTFVLVIENLNVPDEIKNMWNDVE